MTKENKIKVPYFPAADDGGGCWTWGRGINGQLVGLSLPGVALVYVPDTITDTIGLVYITR